MNGQQNQTEWQTKHHHALWNMGYGNDDMQRNGELETIRYVDSIIGYSGATVFDVGANVGRYLKALTDVFASSIEFHAFEPGLSTYKALCANIGGNAPRIFLHSIGMSDKNTIQNLYQIGSSGKYSGLASVYKRDLSSVNLTMDVTEAVKLVTLDSFCESLKINHIHFLKMDVEGHELAALAGARNMLEKQAISVIQFEFGGCNVDARTYFRDFYKLLNPQYSIYRITADGLAWIDNYNVELEIFTTTNYLCIGRHVQPPEQFIEWSEQWAKS